MNDRILRLGTRGSPLARWQAHWVADQLQGAGESVEIVTVQTQGDVTSGSIRQMGGQGVFTKEIQQALLNETIDLAVHSLKDLPTEIVDGLALAAVPRRAATADVMVSHARWDSLQQLPGGARVGTGSMRRRAQLLHARPDLTLLEIRGNVDTRLSKVATGEYDAVVLAAAGLRRLQLDDRIDFELPSEIMLPAVGQGALGIETRLEDLDVQRRLQPLEDLATRASVVAERQLLADLTAGCLAPVGAWGRWQRERLLLEAVVLSPDGTQRLSAVGDAAAGDTAAETARQLGHEVARRLIDQGAIELIAASRDG